MAVRSVRMWKSTDGTTHETEAAARSYDAAQVRLSTLRNVLIEAGQNAPLTIFNSHKLTTQLRDACNSILEYNRRYRPQKVTVSGKP